MFHALKTMQEQDISQIPVFEENLPIGTMYEDQILNLALQGKDLRKLIVREVMSKPMPMVPEERSRGAHYLYAEPWRPRGVRGDG